MFFFLLIIDIQELNVITIKIKTAKTTVEKDIRCAVNVKRVILFFARGKLLEYAAFSRTYIITFC